MKFFLTIFIIISIWTPLHSQWIYPNYNINNGSYNDCTSQKMNFNVPGIITSLSDANNTIINFNLLPSSIRAQHFIELNPGIKVEASCTTPSNTLFEISSSPLCDISILNCNNGTVGLNDKIEIGLRPSNTILTAVNNFLNQTSGPQLNPYNPDHSTSNYVDVVCHFYTPTRSFDSYGFYMRDYMENINDDKLVEVPNDYPFRIRIAPDEIGLWHLKIEIFTAIGNESYSFSACSNTYNNILKFNVIANPSNKGYLEIGLHNSYLRFSNPYHESFFATAFNVAHTYDLSGSWSPVPKLSTFIQHRNFFNQAADYGANFIRVSLYAGSFGIEWENLGVYDSYLSYGLPRNRQENAWELDRIVDLAENKNVFLYLEGISGSFTTDPSIYYNWSIHPYSGIPSVLNLLDVFTDPTVKNYLERKLRYINARWGYSTHIGALEIANEIDVNPGYNSNSFSAIIDNYFLQSAHYLKDILNVKQLLSVSYANEPNHNMMFTSPKLDICDVHAYGQDKRVNFEKRYDIIDHLRTFNKPCIIGEMGFLTSDPNNGVDEYEGCSDASFHNAIWSTAFMGSFGCGANWWWFNAISTNNYDRNFIELLTFMNTIDFEDNKFKPSKWRSGSAPRWRCSSFWPMNVNYLLENYQLTNYSQTRAIGWFHNATWYWANLASYYSCINSLIMPCDDDTYSNPKPGSNMPILRVEGLKWPKMKYYYIFYKTTGGIINDLSSMYWRDGNRKTSLGGTLKIGVNNIDLHLPDLNDFAYKIYRPGYNFREAEDTTGDYELQFDTLCVGDTLNFTGMFEEDSLCINSYYWNFGNNNSSNLCHPSFSFQAPGNYTSYCIISDSDGNRIDSVGEFYTIIDCSDTLIEMNRKGSYQTEENLNLSIYPNPSTGQFYIQNKDNLIYDFCLFDITNKIVRNKKNLSQEFECVDISSFASGIYFLKVVSNSGIEMFKLIKQ